MSKDYKFEVGTYVITDVTKIQHLHLGSTAKKRNQCVGIIVDRTLWSPSSAHLQDIIPLYEVTFTPPEDITLWWEEDALTKVVLPKLTVKELRQHG